MGVIVIDNKRIILKGISKYELNSDEMYFRNDTEEERFLFIFLINQDELWSEYCFKYLYIEMDDGNLYKYFSDKKLYDVMQKMAKYFEEKGIGSEVENCFYDYHSDSYDISEDLEEILEEDEHLGQAVESYVRIRDTFIFVNEDITVIANRIDNAFGII
ncbi:DNA polymerase III subunit alpha [Solibacillus sp. MA9]|uniref:DNA polymerase III subunit alpha n=1 Tax=Solibacillus palustris TaxID=2908203 RepID=A0ABS9UG68_9BACL|nr:DNA polymerase III subunit alpha [Solibacillus sp. MA9]MCH7322915.1 DNA polymerase III subunit alpha [Solibacillus sp. MA9]